MARFNFGAHTLETGTRTYIMGILNITPDSFSDGGKYLDPDAAISRAYDMAREGADIIDIGAQSTRPGHTPVTPGQEWERLCPVLRALKRKIDIPISVDTYYPEVARKAVCLGASIINDVSGGMENGMPLVAAQTGAGLVMMHAGKGADDTGKGGDAVVSARGYFESALKYAADCGLPLDRVCIDPGIGFGKDRQGDLELVSRLAELVKGLPETAIMVGASRKRVIAYCCDTPPPPGDRLAGTIAIHTAAILNGAHILRVHDVAAAVQAARVTDAIMKCR